MNPCTADDDRGAGGGRHPIAHRRGDLDMLAGG
jgi:hypothetical protein